MPDPIQEINEETCIQSKQLQLIQRLSQLIKLFFVTNETSSTSVCDHATHLFVRSAFTRSISFCMRRREKNFSFHADNNQRNLR